MQRRILIQHVEVIQLTEYPYVVGFCCYVEMGAEVKTEGVFAVMTSPLRTVRFLITQPSRFAQSFKETGSHQWVQVAPNYSPLGVGDVYTVPVTLATPIEALALTRMPKTIILWNLLSFCCLQLLNFIFKLARVMQLAI